MIKALKASGFFIDLICWFCPFYSVVITLLFAVNRDFDQCLWAILLLLPFTGSILTSMYAPNAAVYILYHLAAGAVFWIIHLNTDFVTGRLTPWIISGFFLVCMIFFFVKRMHTKKNVRYLQLSVGAAAIFLITWIITDQVNYEPLPIVQSVLACLFMLGWLLSHYLSNLTAYIENNEQLANMPVPAIIQSSHGMILCYMVMAVASILLFTHLGLGRLLSLIGNALLAGIRFLFSLLGKSDHESAAPVTPPSSSDMPLPDAGDTSSFLQFLGNLLLAVAIIAIVIAAAAGLIYLIYALYQRFGQGRLSRQTAAKQTQRFHDVVEKISGPQKNHGLFTFDRMPKDKIRRIYYKKIQGLHKKEVVNAAFTPRELESKITAKDREAVREFTEIYEKVRYGQGNEKNADPGYYKNLAKRI